METKYHNKTATERLVDMFTDDRTGTKDTLIATEASYQQVEELLHLGADPNATFQNTQGLRNPILSFASQCGNTRLVNLLLEHGANANVRDRHGRSCLGLALSSQEVSFATDDSVNPTFGELILDGTKRNFFDRVGTVNALLSHGANVKIFNRTHETPLQNIITGNLKGTLVKQKLIDDHRFYDEDANVNFSVPTFVTDKVKVFDKQVEVVSCVEDREKLFNAMLQTKLNLEEKDQKGFTPLHYALLTNNNPAARSLTDAGADVNAKSQKGFTPIHIAAFKGNAEMVKTLLQKGADAFQKDKKGRDGVDYALSKNRTELATYIKENAPEKVKNLLLRFDKT